MLQSSIVHFVNLVCYIIIVSTQKVSSRTINCKLLSQVYSYILYTGTNLKLSLVPSEPTQLPPTKRHLRGEHIIVYKGLQIQHLNVTQLDYIIDFIDHVEKRMYLYQYAGVTPPVKLPISKWHCYRTPKDVHDNMGFDLS